MKYLTLIRSIALLHQHQREVKTFIHQGNEVRYLEVVPSDIALTNELAQEVLGRSVGELQPQTQKLLGLVHGWAQTECRRLGMAQHEFRFTRRQIREGLGWGDTQLKIHLARLAELEYLVVHRDSHTRVHAYELLYRGADEQGRAHVLGLIDPSTLVPTGTNRPKTLRSEIGRGTVGGQSVSGRGLVITTESNEQKGMEGDLSWDLENTHLGVMNTSTSNQEVI